MPIGSGKVKTLRGYAKTRPIQHGEGDNTEVLENEAQKVHTRFSSIQGPKNMPYGTGSHANAASDEGRAFNGNTVTAPPSG